MISMLRCASSGASPSCTMGASSRRGRRKRSRAIPRSRISISGPSMADAVPVPALAIVGLSVHYGQVPALHDLNLTLDHGVVAVVGRNGMGKTTLCNTVMGLIRASSGSITAFGQDLRALNPYNIANAGIGYVPQGRRIWRSLTVDEHLRLAYRGKAGAVWTVEHIYE